MEHKFFIGVDGGGTNTRALIIDGSGLGLGLGNSGPSNYQHVGIETAKKNIGLAIEAAWKCAGMEPRPGTGAFLGMAGVTGMADHATILDMATQLQIAAPGHVGVDHDIRILLAGGLGGEPGIALIVGTGSSCYGRDSTGHAVQVGGFGPLMDDLGSGYALGVQAMRAAVFAADGRGSATALSAPVLKFLSISGMDDFCRRVYHEGLTRTQIASLAPVVVSCADAGDAAANEILRQGAGDLAKMVATAMRRIGGEGSVSVVIGGGLGEAETIYRQEILTAIGSLAPRAKIKRLLFPPVAGAAILAMEVAGRKFGNVERENLKKFFIQEVRP